MRDLEKVNKTLLKAEYDEAQCILHLAKEQGFSLKQTAILCYRCGVIDGKKAQSKKLKALHDKFNAYKAQMLSSSFESVCDEIVEEMNETLSSLPQAQTAGSEVQTNE